MYKVMSSRQVVYMVELVGQLEAGREVPREKKSYNHIAGKWRNNHPEASCYITGVMLNCPQRQSLFLPLLVSSLSLSLVIHPSIHPSREHQQCLCSGLHQRITDSKRPAGSRKPALLSRIHSHCQGELLNMRQLFHQHIKRLLLNQCRVWV